MPSGLVTPCLVALKPSPSVTQPASGSSRLLHHRCSWRSSSRMTRYATGQRSVCSKHLVLTPFRVVNGWQSECAVAEAPTAESPEWIQSCLISRHAPAFQLHCAFLHCAFNTKSRTTWLPSLLRIINSAAVALDPSPQSPSPDSSSSGNESGGKTTTFTEELANFGHLLQERVNAPHPRCTQTCCCFHADIPLLFSCCSGRGMHHESSRRARGQRAGGALEAQAAARFTSARDLVVVLDARIERVLETQRQQIERVLETQYR